MDGVVAASSASGRAGGFRAAFLVAGFAIATRVALVLSMPMAPLAEVAVSGDGDTRYYVRLAQHLNATREYAQGHLRAYMPPGYPFFLSGLLRLGADSRTIQVVQNLLYLLAVLFLATLGARKRGWPAGMVVAILALASPSWFLLPQRALSETLFVILLAIGMSVALAGPAPPGFGLAFAAGLLFGLAALVRETGLPLGAVLGLVVGVWAWRVGMRARGVLLGATVLLGTVLVIFPWSVRNYSIFGRIVPICTNGPVNFYIGNNPEATGVYQWRLPAEAQAVWNRPDEGSSNELFASRLAARDALAFVRAHPSRTMALVPRRLWALWGPPVALHAGFGVDALVRSAAAALWFACLGLGVLGLWRMRREPLAWFIVGACLTAVAVHAATFGDVRFRAAHEYMLMLPAGAVVAGLWRERAARMSRPGPAPPSEV